MSKRRSSGAVLTRRRALSFFWFRRGGTPAFLGLLWVCARVTYFRRLKLGDDHNAWNRLLNDIHDDGFNFWNHGFRHSALLGLGRSLF